MPAFEKAIELGVHGVELDVQRSKDGELVVIHDETINRTSNGFGKVVDLTLEDLRYCNFNNGFVAPRKATIPTLKQVLELFKPTDLIVNVELKNSIEFYPGMDRQVAEMVRELGMTDQVIFSSFNHFSLANLRGIVPAAQLGLLYSEGLFEPWKYAIAFGAGCLHPHYSSLQQPDLMWFCHEAGLKVHTWTVDKDEDVEALAKIGVDAIITNMPEHSLRAVATRR